MITFGVDHLSHGFFMGVGTLCFTRGLGPITNISIIPEAVVPGRQGGPGPHARAEVAPPPDIVGADVTKKKRGCK